MTKDIKRFQTKHSEELWILGILIIAAIVVIVIFKITKDREGDSTKIFYFEPEKKFTSKRILSKDILSSLQGEIKITDPYCNERTLDILKDIKDDVNVKFLTKMENLKKESQGRFLRELKDFKAEKKNIEFRNYPYPDIHDRYIISSDFLVLLGQSIKDLGSKESLVVVLNKNVNKTIFEDVVANFNKRWNNSRDIFEDSNERFVHFAGKPSAVAG